MTNKLFIGESCFSPTAFFKISEQYNLLCAKNRLVGTEVIKGKKSLDEQNRHTAESRFWKSLVRGVPNFSDAADKYIERGGSYKDFLLEIIEDLYKSENREFDRDAFDQLIRKKWINEERNIDFSSKWIDLFSALDKKFRVFKEDLKIISEMPTAFYYTQLGELAFELGWGDNSFLYVRNPRHLVIFCAIFKHKTSAWEKEFYEQKISPIFKKNDFQGNKRTATVMHDICEILKSDDSEWESSIVKYVLKNVGSFDGGVVVDKLHPEKPVEHVSGYSEKTESLTISGLLYNEINKVVGSKNIAICYLSDSIDHTSVLFKKIFANPQDDDNKNNLLRYGDNDNYSDDISYLRKLLLIAKAEEFIKQELICDVDEVISEINYELIYMGVRPIYSRGKAWQYDVFDWYLQERLKFKN